MRVANYININGVTVPAGQAKAYSNSAFRYGVGLFETILILDGEIMLWQYHQSRLLIGMHVLGFKLPETIAQKPLEDHILDVVRKNSLLSRCKLRLQVFSENGSFGHTDNTIFIAECFEVDPSVPALNETGLKLGYAQGIVKSFDSLANLKTTSALGYSIAAHQAKTNGWDDALLFNQHRNIIETSIANIFWVKERSIFTPTLSEGCIAGTMRRYLLDHLPDAGFSVIEQPLTKEILKSADAAFLTNAIRRIKWIRSIDDTEYDMGIIPDIAKKLLS